MSGDALSACFQCCECCCEVIPQCYEGLSKCISPVFNGLGNCVGDVGRCCTNKCIIADPCKMLACCDKCLLSTCNTCSQFCCCEGPTNQGVGGDTYCFCMGDTSSGSGDCCCPSDIEDQVKCWECCACLGGAVALVTGSSAVVGYLMQQGAIHFGSSATASATASFLVTSESYNAVAATCATFCSTCCAVEAVHLRHAIDYKRKAVKSSKNDELTTSLIDNGEASASSSRQPQGFGRPPAYEDIDRDSKAVLPGVPMYGASPSYTQ